MNWKNARLLILPRGGIIDSQEVTRLLVQDLRVKDSTGAAGH